jgi:hypothetical protein
MFYSMYDSNGVIIGTQWLGNGNWLGEGDDHLNQKERTKVENESFYKLTNLEDKDYMFKTSLAKSLYRTYISKKNPDKVFKVVQAYCG